MTFDHPIQKVNFSNITIVLQRPRYPENIGATARAMRNMDFTRLIVVDPENFDMTRASKMATHFAEDILKEALVLKDLKKALEPFQYVIGCTARKGKYRQNISTPTVIAQKLIDISQENPVAILFGPESRGLSIDHVHLCNDLVNIPTANFSSLNLAQAVMVMCYELFNASKESGAPPSSTQKYASRVEMEGMYDHIEKTLIEIQFVNPENPHYWMNKLRRFFARLPLRSQEVKMIRGLCRQVVRYGKYYATSRSNG